MKKILLIVIIMILIISCSGCENKKLDLEKLYEKNSGLALDYFYGWREEEFKHELIIFEPENATELELELCSPYYLNGVEKVLYVKYENDIISPYVVALQYKSVRLAKEAQKMYGSQEFLREANILALPITPAYMFLYGEYKEVDGYYLSPDGKALLFDTQLTTRTDIVIPKGVKCVAVYSLLSSLIKTIKCNEELEVLYSGAFGYFSSLEKVELNDGLKEIGPLCFAYHNLEYIVIPKSVEYIGAEAFRNVTIYCEIEEKPIGWDENFAGENCKIYWGETWKYVEGVPRPNRWIDR